MKNNIKNILKSKEMSINQLAKGLDKSYAFTYNLVNRKDLLATQLGTLVLVAKFLEVEITELYM